MMTRPSLYLQRATLRLILAPLTFIFILAAPLWGQANTAGGAGAGDVKIEVLDVATGTGSRTAGSGGAELKIEAVPVNPAALEGPMFDRMSGTGALTPEEQKIADQHKDLFAALTQKRTQTMATYNFNIRTMDDPFLPIKEVRGTVEEKLANDRASEANLPPILRLELTQLKLVAITILSSNPNNSWASFEDGTGASYILKVGQNIGRNHGRITKIMPNEVVVEETGRTGNDRPKITTIKLDVTKTDGLTLTNQSEAAQGQ
ncbi:MAG: pilus assembly protein PilP [Candidatus Adiutrix sp.]|jgi:type IV pilus assembly protein PilP|nr:pilus assembly protein PilP [Candidatus Adiutrix sp.]